VTDAIYVQQVYTKSGTDHEKSNMLWGEVGYQLDCIQMIALIALELIPYATKKNKITS
jgi:hypothetical protein